MRRLMPSFTVALCVSVTVVALAMITHGQEAGEVSSATPIDRSAMLEVCEKSAAVEIDPEGDFQCGLCPSYTDFQGSRESFRLNKAYQGHFSAPNTEQLLLALNGCEPHVSGFGGSILLTRDGTAWKRSAYFKGDNASNCLSFRAHDGLDRLVCLAGDAHFGTSAEGIIAESYKDASLHQEPLLQGIGSNMGGTPQSGYCYEQDIAKFEKLPSGTGLKVVVTQTKGLAPPGEGSCGETEIQMEPAQTLNLNFQFDGDHFALTPESKGSLQKINDFLPHP
jgi:hypothetical protein